MHRILNFILLLLAVSIFMATPSMAQKKKLPKKPPRNILMSDLAEPDEVAGKSAVDRPGREVEETYSAGGVMSNGPHGLDVSHYQGRIDWTQVAKDDHASYVYIKASEGESNVDDMYLYNFRAAKRAGLKVGSYHFFRANVKPEIQLKNFLSMVTVKQQDLLPLIDVEAIPSGMSHDRFRQVLNDFLKLVTREFGKRPMIYTGKNFYNKIFAGHGYGKYKFMIACYTIDEPVLNNNDDFVIWQYTSTGRAKGIRGNVDISRIRGRHSLKEIYY